MTLPDYINSLIPQQISLNDYFDIAILSIIFYRIIILMQGTRNAQIIFGGLLVVIIYFVANFFDLLAVHSTLNLFFSSLVVIVVVLFNSEIRRELATVGRGSFRWRKKNLSDPYFFDRLYQACEYFSNNSLGALIVIEKSQSLKHYADSGTVLDARLSSPLLVSIFSKESPLHDGAILIDRSLRVHATSCILPLTSRIDLKIKMGTRHRSAIGISEETDCLVLVVSEETGNISFFEDGVQEIVSLKNFKQKLTERLLDAS